MNERSGPDLLHFTQASERNVVTRIADQTLEHLLGGIASTAPAPGAGAAGALALALGIACARKAVRISGTHRSNLPELADADTELAEFGRAALAGADRDARGFTEWIAARRQAAGRDGDDPGRVGNAAAALVEVGESLSELALMTRLLILRVTPMIVPALASDLDAALRLVDACRAIEDANADESRRALDRHSRETR